MARGTNEQAYLILNSEKAVILQDHHTHRTEVAGKFRAPHFQHDSDKRLVDGSCGIHCAPYGNENLWTDKIQSLGRELGRCNNARVGAEHYVCMDQGLVRW